MSADVLSRRALGRATLARQLLLDRAAVPALQVVERLVGMQAQEPLDPYTALWSRVDGFRPGELAQLLLDRKAVRIAAMRATIHLLSADDCLVLRPLMQPVLDRELARHPEFGPALRGVEIAPVLAYARARLAEKPRAGRELRAVLGERFPEHDAAALAYACRCLLALVQVPPRGVWGQTLQATLTPAETWLGRPLAEDPSLDEVVLRYFGAFGPASVADVAAWSRLTGLREVVERLRPRLRTFRDERGRELFDLPDAPRPDPDTPAPARFLPEYDNVLLSHDDRSRFHADGRSLTGAEGRVRGTVLEDGLGAAVWRIEREGDRATLVISHVAALTNAARQAIEAEGVRYLRFAAGDAENRDVRLVALRA